MKCVIMAGGSGDRLWPLSRKNYPKQFMEIQEKRSLLQETVVRNMPYCEEYLIVTNAGYEFIVEGQMQAFQGLKYHCVYEETARNTFAAVTILSMLENPSELLYVVTADTIIEGAGYRENVLEAMEYAKKGETVVFGIRPDCANSRFGYIRREGNRVVEFREKPSAEEAGAYVQSGDYLWNSGMFLMRAGDFAEEVRKYHPEWYRQCRKLAQEVCREGGRLFFGGNGWANLPSISVEKAVFEHSSSLRVIEAAFSWVDVDELEDVIPLMEQSGRKNVILNQCENVSVVNRTHKQLVVGEQLKNLKIVNTEDALYVAPGDCTSSIKELMTEYQSDYGAYFERNRIAYRRWGNYEVLSQGKGFKVKRVTIYPGGTIYSHKHGYRSEHWSVVSGCARITLGNETKDYLVNESIYVEAGVVHQVSNPFEENLIIIEVGVGNTIAESDMVHMENAFSHENSFAVESIVRLEPAYKDYLWGGTKLRKQYGKQCDYEVLAESWELSAHPAGQSVIAEGKYKGMLFGDYVRRMDKENLGWKCKAYEEFPILVKFIDARERLSVQVHPDDAFALVNEHEYGKNEMWYIMDCEEDARLYCGFKKDITREELLSAIEQERLLELLHEIKVRKGDTIFIPAGTVHAIGAGVLVCEIQQNSNSTYRIYDYGRKDKYGNGRELHLDKALQVLKLTAGAESVVQKYEPVQCNGYQKQILGQCKYFESIRVDVSESAEWMTDDASFTAVVILEGKGMIAAGDKTLSFVPGDTFFIPAGRRKVMVKGVCRMILSRV